MDPKPRIITSSNDCGSSLSPVNSDDSPYSYNVLSTKLEVKEEALNVSFFVDDESEFKCGLNFSELNYFEHSSGQVEICINDIQSDEDQSEFGHCKSPYKDEHSSDNVKLCEVTDQTGSNSDENSEYCIESLLDVNRVDEVVFNTQGKMIIKKIQKLVRQEKEEFFGFYNSDISSKLQINSKTKEKPTYACHFCSASTSSKQYLRKHTLLHTKLKRPIVECGLCSFKSTSKIVRDHSWQKHLSSRHCLYCSFVSKNRKSLATHLLLHTKYKMQLFRCSYCSYESPMKNLQSHILHSHNTRFPHQSMERPHRPISISTTFCNICRFNEKCKSAENQVSVDQRSRDNQNCRSNTVATKERKIAINEIKKNKKDAVSGSKKDPKMCKNNNYGSKYKNDKDSMNIFTCLNCDFKSKYKGNWARHLINCKLQNNKGEDQLIGLKPAPKSHPKPGQNREGSDPKLSVHKKQFLSVHSGYQCDVCNFKTNYENSLRIHKIILHNSSPDGQEKSDLLSKEFCCDTCGFKAKTDNGLQKHKLTHKHSLMNKTNHKKKAIQGKADFKSFPCDMCDFVAKNKCGWASHNLFHKRRQKLIDGQGKYLEI